MKDVLARPGAYPGSLLLVAAVAGIGRPSLMPVLCALARERGFGVLSPSGRDLKQDFAYGVVRQLVEPRLAAAPARERAALLEAAAWFAALTGEVESSSTPESGPGVAADRRSSAALGPPFSVFLYRAGLAAPLAPVDDARALDTLSLRFRACLGGRLEEQPILLLVHPAWIAAGLPSPAIEFDRPVAILGDGTELRRTRFFQTGEGLCLALPMVRAVIDEDVPPAKLSRGRGQGGRTPLDDLGLVVFAASTAIHCARIDLLVGNLSAAEEELRRAYKALASITETYLLSPIAELLAEVVCAQGRCDEAEEISRAAEELWTSDDVGLEALWPAARGPALAWRERADEAERRAREAVDLIRTRAALSRLTTWVSQNATAYNQRSASDRRAGHPNQRAVPAVPGLTRELFMRDILANEKLSDSYARAVALETLDMPEELFAQR
jgi:hypothetical protein